MLEVKIGFGFCRDAGGIAVGRFLEVMTRIIAVHKIMEVIREEKDDGGA